MKILYITNGISGSGGLERVIAVKGNYLSENLGYEVHILTLNQGKESPFYKFSNLLHFHDITVGGNLIQYFQSYKKGICEIINKIGPDVISVCDDGVKGLFVPKIIDRKIPIIYERHTTKWTYLNSNRKGYIKNLKYLITDYLLNYGSSLYDRFVVLTPQNGKEWPKSKLEIIPNPTSFYPSIPATLENKRVISVGTRSFTKGFDLLIQAWKRVAKDYPDWELAIYGKEVEDNDLQKLINELNLQQHINLYPPTITIEKEYKASSIYALPSRYEGFGMVLIEAMSNRLPCVAFDCPCGPADIISNGVDGYLVPPENVNVLAGKLMDLMEDVNLRKRMGSAGRENVMRYHPDEIVPLWDALFRKLTNKKVNYKCNNIV